MCAWVWDRIVPSVRRCEPKRGMFPVPAEIRVGCEQEESGATVGRVLDSIRRISELGRRDPRWAIAPVAAAATVVVRLDREALRDVSPDPSRENDEAYLVRVLPESIIVIAGAPDGIARGLATLYQAILHAVDECKEEPVYLPAAEIVDIPAHQWRGFMLDTARHFFPPESLTRFIDFLWFFRLNRFHLHLTDDQGWRVPISGYPALTEVGGWRHDRTSEQGRYGGSYSAGELAAVDSGAAFLGIQVVPEIDLPGHASAAITAYPEIGCSGTAPGVETRWGIFDAVICPVGDASTRFVDAVFSSVSELFQGEYIHVGGDEVITRAWEESSLCREHVRNDGAGSMDDLYGTIVRRMTESVIRHGKRPLAWDEASGLELPEKTIILNWREPQYAATALKRGYDIVLVPQNRRAYLDHRHRDGPLESGRLGICTVRDSASFEPDRYVREALREIPGDRIGSVLGGQANLWTEAIPTHRDAEYMALLRLAAISEGLWRGAPGEDRWNAVFSDALDRLRCGLFSRGFNVYPGPLE